MPAVSISGLCCLFGFLYCNWIKTNRTAAREEEHRRVTNELERRVFLLEEMLKGREERLNNEENLQLKGEQEKDVVMNAQYAIERAPRNDTGKPSGS